MKAQEIREMRAQGLGEKLDELHKKLFSLRAQSVTEKMENTGVIGNVKRDIARVKTIIRERQLKGD